MFINCCMRRAAVFVSLFVLLAGCAYSPQMVTVTPQIALETGMPGQGRMIRVSAVDHRKNPVLGTLGGIYGDSSSIGLANDVEQALLASVSDALMRLGFVADPSYQGDLRLAVSLDELVYSCPDNVYSNKVDMRTVVSIEASRAGSTYRNSYRSKAEKRFVGHPDQAENQQQINTMLSDTLTRVFKDSAFIDFISR